jgi:rhomboid protease GluP
VLLFPREITPVKPICPNCGAILPYTRGITCAKCLAPLDERPDPVVAGASASPIPWLTLLAVVVEVGIYLDILFRPDDNPLATYARWGFVQGEDIWRGKVWGLFTSAFLHADPIHLGGNVYWLWVLGIRLERAVGRLRWVALFLLSSLVSSSCELAASDETGVGFSGVAFAFFGFMWVTRSRFPSFAKRLGAKSAAFFAFALLAGIWVTATNVLNVANYAHISGLVFGATAGAVYLRPWRRVAVAGVALWVGMAVMVLFWCPWSLSWLHVKAAASLKDADYVKALDYYTRIIRRDPLDTRAYGKRSLVHVALGQWDEALEDMSKAGEPDPNFDSNRDE